MAFAALIAAAGAALPDWNAPDYSGSTDLIPVSTSAVAPNSIPGASRVARLLVNKLFKTADVAAYTVPVKRMIKTIQIFVRHWGDVIPPNAMASMASLRFGYANSDAIADGLLEGLGLTAESLMVSTPEVSFVFKKYDTMVSQVMQAHGVNPAIGNPLFWGYTVVALHNGAFNIANMGNVYDTPVNDTPAAVVGPNPNGVPKALEVLSRILGYNIGFPNAYIIGQGGPNITSTAGNMGGGYKRRRSSRGRDSRGRFTRRY